MKVEDEEFIQHYQTTFAPFPREEAKTGGGGLVEGQTGLCRSSRWIW